MPEEAKDGADEMERLRGELRDAEERRSEEALKLLGEVIDLRQSGCFWLVVSVTLILTGAAVWLLKRSDGTGLMWTYVPVCLAAGCLLLSFFRFVRTMRADTFAEETIAALDSEISGLRERADELAGTEDVDS